ncbi:DUF2142 domain-containing protein [Microbacterium binotii]|uniref:DUF2142 domain-containing protein n=1 Tax=Microbacterium binotii TaxID=462710 RepID=UPI001F28B926|nr:DUF2142 domain-containing protein [Microbacterium binotii]UIN29873.1 DUF2142 domain-containing protein [Microbacterium binotii]
MRRPRKTPLQLTFMILVPVLAFLTLGAWSFASPVAASPDEDFHMASIWCGLGDREGLCEDPGDPVERLIPTAVTTATCYAFHADRSAGCWDPAEPGMTLVQRANVDGLYPRVFYAAMSVFASPDIQLSVATMRLVNSAFAVALLTVVFWALPRGLRTPLVVSVTATSVPLGLFVFGSTNPSSWALLSAATVWITLYASTRTAGRRRLVLLGLALFGAIIGGGARADSAAYTVFAVVLALFLGVRSVRQQIVPLTVGAVMIVVSAAFYLGAAQGSAVVSGLDNDKGPLSGFQIIMNALNVPTLWTGALGGWGLGWIDTSMPGIVTVMSTFVFAGAFFIGVHRATPRRLVAVGLTVLAMWAVPFLLLYQSRATVGELVQPRYILPLMIIAVGVASMRVSAARAWAGPRAITAAVALVIGAAIALHTNIRRYTTGVDTQALDPGANAQWWWPGAPSPLVTWIVGSLAFAGVLAAMAFLAARSEVVRPQAEAAAAGDEANRA